MNKKKFRLSKHGTWLLENDRRLFHWYNDDVEIVELLNALHEENQSLKKQNRKLHEDLHKVTEITRGY